MFPFVGTFRSSLPAACNSPGLLSIHPVLVLTQALLLARDLVLNLKQALVHSFDFVDLLLWSIRRLKTFAIQNLIFSMVGFEVKLLDKDPGELSWDWCDRELIRLFLGLSAGLDSGAVLDDEISFGLDVPESLVEKPVYVYAHQRNDVLSDGVVSREADRSLQPLSQYDFETCATVGVFNLELGKKVPVFSSMHGW